MKFGNIEIPPKKEKSLSFKEKREIVNKFELDPNSLTQEAIDDNGNIVNCSDLFSSLLDSNLKKEMGDKNFDEFKENSLYDNELSVPLFWKNIEFHDKLSFLINNNFFRKDIEKIIAIQCIRDIENELFSGSEGDTHHVDQLIKENLIKKVNNASTTLLEKSFLREAIYNITENENIYSDKHKRSTNFSLLEKEIGGVIDLSTFYNKNLSKYDFDFNDEQKELLLDDSENIGERNSIDYKEVLSHISVKNIDPEYLDPWDSKDFYIEGDYVNSLLAPGIIGVYSRSGRLVGWQEDNDLDINKRNKIEDFSEIRKKSPSILKEDIALFKVSSSLYFRDYVQKTLNIDLSLLNIENQFYFLNFIQGKTEYDLKDLKDFIDSSRDKNDKNNRLRTFLSIEHGGKEMGDKIITLGQKLPDESARVLFEKYGEIIDEVDNIGGYIEKSMKGKVSPLIIEKAKENLLIKGKDLLNSYAVKADICNGEECLDIGRELEDKLSNIKASLLLFASACKSLSEYGEISLDDLANTELEVVHGLSVDEKTQEEMKRIFRENRPNYPDKLLQDVSKEFEDNIKNIKDNQTFYILKNNGDITSFMRLDEEEDGSVYGASFNVRTELRGSTIGSELLRKIIEKESTTRPFKIICYEKNPMLEKYQSNFGFEIIGTIENYHNTGEKFYEMIRNPGFKQ